MNVQIKKHNVFLILITTFVLLGYREIAFMKYTAVYDIIDAYYPWRYFIGECLQNHILPLWEPYQHLGSPIHANPQSGAWYPVVWFFGYLFGYSMTIMHIEIVFHLIFAAFGFYFLLVYLKIERKYSTVFACIYIYSGFFVGNAQHISWIISATWIPFILLFYLKALENNKHKEILLTAFFIFLLATGGYPPFVVVLAYILIGISIYKGILSIKKKSAILKLISTNTLILLFSSLLSSVIIVSIFHSATWFSRGTPIALSKAIAIADSFTPQSCLSLVFPLATTQYKAFFMTDISMSNAYFGIISVLIIIYACFFYCQKKQVLYFSLAFLFLILAMGFSTPIYTFLFKYMPGFSYNRATSLFRFFAISAFLIGVASSYNQFLEEKKIKKITISWFILVFISFCIITLSYYKYRISVNTENQNSFYYLIVKQGLFQIAMLCFVLAIMFFVKNYRVRFLIISFLLLFDAYYAARLNFPYTVHSSTSVLNFEKQIIDAPKGFPINNDTISKFDEYKFQRANLYCNLAIYQKKHSINGYNPFVLLKYQKMFNNDSLKLYTEHPLLFSEDSMSKITINSYTPNKLIATIYSKKDNYVVLLQNYMPDWEVTIDGIQTKVELYKDTFITFPVSKSSRIIEIEYRPQSVIMAMWVSIISVLMLLTALLFICLTSENSKSETKISNEN
ncbi:MAG: YfhO family protein [Bacteroidota bacterium]